MLVVAAAIALVVRLISWFRTPEAVAVSGKRLWPGGMGTLDSVARRFPALQANDASVKLAALAKALPKNEAVDDFLAARDRAARMWLPWILVTSCRR